MSIESEHHYVHPRVVEVTLQHYWEKEELVALEALRVARQHLAGLAFQGQMVLGLESNTSS